MAVSRTGRKSGKLVHHIFVTSLGPSHTFFIYFQNFPFFCGLFDRQQKSPPRALTLNLRHEPRAPFKMKKKKESEFCISIQYFVLAERYDRWNLEHGAFVSYLVASDRNRGGSDRTWMARGTFRRLPPPRSVADWTISIPYNDLIGVVLAVLSLCSFVLLLLYQLIICDLARLFFYPFIRFNLQAGLPSPIFPPSHRSSCPLLRIQIFFFSRPGHVCNRSEGQRSVKR